MNFTRRKVFGLLAALPFAPKLALKVCEAARPHPIFSGAIGVWRGVVFYEDRIEEHPQIQDEAVKWFADARDRIFFSQLDNPEGATGLRTAGLRRKYQQAKKRYKRR